MNLQDLTIDQLIKLRNDKALELQTLDADFTIAGIDAKKKNRSKAEIADDEEWRIQAVEDKRNLCNDLRMIKAEIKAKNGNGSHNDNTGRHLKNISMQLDKIIELMIVNK